jgi:hypothetical protein
MAKRSYTRRSDGEIIEDLQAKIEQLQQRIHKKERSDVAVVKELPRVKRTMARFMQLCLDNGREDLSNTVMAFLATLDRQAKDLPAGKNVPAIE